MQKNSKKERKERKKQAKKEDRKNFLKMAFFTRSVNASDANLLNMNVHLHFVFFGSHILISALRSTILTDFYGFPQSLE
jgi:hypothetical protein